MKLHCLLTAALAMAPTVVLSVDPVLVQLTWSEYMTQSFYHVTVAPLLLTTIVLAYVSRPSTSDDMPSGFMKFQWTYLTVWSLCVAADWLQGPYVYALYAAYGFSSKEIAELFVAGFGSSMVFGCFVGTFTDKFGRKNCCMLYCLLYIASCITKHFKLYSILMVGRVTGGIATSMLFSCFECWMVSEHTQRHKFSGGLLGFMFGMMFTLMYCVAIASGLAGQAVADAFVFKPWSEGGNFYTGGYCCPFDLAIGCLIVGIVLIAITFEENYGISGKETSSGESASLIDNLKIAARILMTDARASLLGVVVSGFEGSMFAFVFNWTPALKSDTTPPPHGVIFALFMMSCMCGASASTLLGGVLNARLRLVGSFAAGFAAFVCASIATSTQEEHLRLSMLAFLVFEFCVGVYFPSVGVLKSEVVPERVRGTVYNMYRVPLNGIVVGLLLSDITMATCFKLCAFLMALCFVSVLSMLSKVPGEVSDAKVPKASDREGDIEMKGGDYQPVSQNDEVGDILPSVSTAATTTMGRKRNVAVSDAEADGNNGCQHS